MLFQFISGYVGLCRSVQIYVGLFRLISVNSGFGKHRVRASMVERVAGIKANAMSTSKLQELFASLHVVIFSCPKRMGPGKFNTSFRTASLTELHGARARSKDKEELAVEMLQEPWIRGL